MMHLGNIHKMKNRKRIFIASLIIYFTSPINSLDAQSVYRYSLTFSTVREGSSNVVRLRALTPFTAVVIAQTYYVIPTVFFLDGNIRKEISFPTGSLQLRQEIRSKIEEVDQRVHLFTTSPDSEKDSFWRIISRWAVDHDTINHPGLMVPPDLEPRYQVDSILESRVNMKALLALDSLLSASSQEEHKPEILLWLGHLAYMLSRYTEAQKYYRMLLELFPEKKELCLVSEFHLSHVLLKEGKFQQADSILDSIPIKYSKLKEYELLFEASKVFR